MKYDKVMNEGTNESIYYSLALSLNKPDRPTGHPLSKSYSRSHQSPPVNKSIRQSTNISIVGDEIKTFWICLFSVDGG